MGTNQSMPVRLVDGIRKVEGINGARWIARYAAENRPLQVGGEVISAHMTAYVDADTEGEIQVICLATGEQQTAEVSPGLASTVEFPPIKAAAGADSLILFRGRVTSGDGSLYIMDAGATSGDGDTAVEVTRPTFTQQPQSLIKQEGSQAILTIQVAGAQSVQWYKNEDLIVGETDSVLVLDSLILADSGAVYWVRATNSAGDTDSERATITVTATPVDPVFDWDVLLQKLNVTKGT